MSKKLSAVQRNRGLILKMEAQRKSLGAIARAIGTNRRHVRQFLRSQGVKHKFPQWRTGALSANWRGGRIVDQDGYVLVYCVGHPAARKYLPNHVLEHRLVMETHLGRLLLPGEVVHHKNKAKQDNRLENLEVFDSNGKHLQKELAGKCPKWSPDGKARILRAVVRPRARKQKGILRLKEHGAHLLP